MNNPILAPASRDRELHLVFVFLCFVLLYFTWFPGVFTQDELDIFNQSMGAPRHDGHSPLMVRFWSLTGRIFPGPALPYSIGLAAVLYFSLCLFKKISLTRAGSAIALFVLIALPPVFVTLGLVTKDLFFVAAMLAVFVALANHVGQAKRKTLLVTALAMQLAVLIRVDAIFALFPLLVYLSWRELTAVRRASFAINAAALVAGAMLVLCFMGISRFANTYVFKVSPYHAEQVTMLFDLSAMSVDTDMMLLPASRLGGGYPLPVLRARFNPAIADGLIWSTDANHLVYHPGANHAELAAAWLGGIRNYPLSYLKFRAEYMAKFIGLRNDAPRLRGHFFADESMVGDGSLGWRKTHSPLQQFYYQLSETDIGKYLFMPWLWLVTGLLVLFGFAAGWLRAHGTRVERIVPQLLVISALSYTFLMSAISTAAMGRYHAWPRMAIGLALLAALSQLVPAFKARLMHARQARRQR
ncbi:hypothetical protein ACSUZJ_04900 [Telluria sp. B2]